MSARECYDIDLIDISCLLSIQIIMILISNFSQVCPLSHTPVSWCQSLFHCKQIKQIQQKEQYIFEVGEHA